MNIRRLITGAICFAVILTGLNLQAQTPELVNYQGRLTDASGLPLDTTVSITFRIYDDTLGTTELFQESHPSVVVTEGLFSVLLGSISVIGANVFSGPVRGLSLQLSGGIESSPLIPLVSANHSHKADWADTAAYALSAPTDSGFWGLVDTVLYTNDLWGVSRGQGGNAILGNGTYSIVNWGAACTTGVAGQDSYDITISGGEGNGARAYGATVSGGVGNRAGNDETDTAAVVAGGLENNVAAMYGSIGGGRWNNADSMFSTIAGGHHNNAINNFSFIGGGSNNSATGGSSVVAGGAINWASGAGSTIGGGSNNLTRGAYSTVPGGYNNSIDSGADYSYLFGIGSSLIQDSTFMVDMPHIRFGDEFTGYEFPSSDGTTGQVMSTNGAGQLNWTDLASGGGLWTLNGSVLSTNDLWGVSRGQGGNAILGNGTYSIVNWGAACTTGVAGQDSYDITISGGEGNGARAYGATVSGGVGNKAGDESIDTAVVIGGGVGNIIYGKYGTIGGGILNRTNGEYATIAGGDSNIALGDYCVLGGGSGNTALGSYSSVGGGMGNKASGYNSTVAGGTGNIALSAGATVGGGQNNLAQGIFSTVSGGSGDTITSSGEYSYLVGIGSKLTQDSTFMVDMPHIRFGDETNGYEFPTTDGSAGAVLVTNGAGNLFWGTSQGVHWTLSPDNVLWTDGEYGLARANNTLYGTGARTMVNIGTASVTGDAASDERYCTVGGGFITSATKEYSTVSGGFTNAAEGYASTIGGGYQGIAFGPFSSILGGADNTAFGSESFIGGGRDNFIALEYGTVVGGYADTLHAAYGVIVGGRRNTSNNTNDTAIFLGGGSENSLDGSYSVLTGGRRNSINARYASILGGYADTIATGANYSYLFGLRSKLTQDSTFMVAMPHIRFGDEISGYEFPSSDGANGQVLSTNGTGHLSWVTNPASGNWSVSGEILYTNSAWGLARGGVGNVNYGNAGNTMVNFGAACTTGANGFNFSHVTVSGGYGNASSQSYSTIGGGLTNTVVGYAGVIGGGESNRIASSWATVSGGKNNLAGTEGSTVGGGVDNYAWGSHSVVGGGQEDSAHGRYSGVAAGWSNLAGNYIEDTACFIGGGYNNSVTAPFSTIGGGTGNSVSNDRATIAGGRNHTITAKYGVIGGGNTNQVTGSSGVVCGGGVNVAGGDLSGVVSGWDNQANGYRSFSGGGAWNRVGNNYAVVTGGSKNVTGADYAVIGGGQENSNAGAHSVIPGGYRDTVTAVASNSLVFGRNVYLNTANRVVFFDGVTHGRLGINRDDHQGGVAYPLHIGTNTSNGNGAHLTAGGVWVAGSSRTFKEDFQPLDGDGVLASIAALPVEAWRYKNTDERHIGPVAEDFVATFDVGTVNEGGFRDSMYLAPGDVAGVALIGVKELNSTVQKLTAENNQLKNVIADLQARLEKLEKK